jgi:hypothetical protein
MSTLARKEEPRLDGLLPPEVTGALSTPPRSEIALNSLAPPLPPKLASSSMINAPRFGFSFLARPHSGLMIRWGESDAYKKHALRLQQSSLISLGNLRWGKPPCMEISYFGR